MKLRIMTGVLVAVCAHVVAAQAATTCDALASMKLTATTITLAEVVPAGAFKPPTGGGQFDKLPAFCRVAATLRPSADSDIKIEVWLPAAGWNGKFQAVGNGGWAGSITYPAMGRALAQGYATASTDTGHTGSSGIFALGHIEKLIDFAYRAPHEMTVAAKSLTSAFYGSGPSKSYWNGCSTGGRQALQAASRYPNDFDGIIAGASANPKTHLDSWRMLISQAMFKDAASTIPAAKFPVVHAAVVQACDLIDGVKDGLIEDPRQCTFDPGVLTCKNGDGPSCLTEAQVATARVLMTPRTHPRTGEEIFPTYSLGSELGWGYLLTGPDPFANALDSFRYAIFNDAKWDWRTFDLERDLAASDRISAGQLGPISTDLSAFAKRGGKLVMYHGWSDPSIAPRASINYYEAALKNSTGPKDFARLFMVPGMGHCSGGEGPDNFDMVPVLDAWITKGTAPAQVTASKIVDGKVTRTRPLCPFPQKAKYKGTGSIDEAASFSCVAP